MRFSHAHPPGNVEKLLKMGIFLSLGIFLLELFGGIWSHSLALLSDAWHIFIDIWALVISYLAIYLANRPVSHQRTYGLHRMEVIAALINGLAVFGIAAWIFYAAIERFQQPRDIDGGAVTLIAIIGLGVNLIVAGMFYRSSENDLNLRSVFLHVVSDALSSVAVIGAGVVIMLTGWRQIDPIVSAGVAVLVLWNAGRLLRESLNTLLEGVPRGIQVTAVEDHIKQVEGVLSVHDLHVWSICSHMKALSGHVLLDPGRMPFQDKVLEGINQNLKDRFGITHTTIQVESKAWPGVEQLY
jgi:cobalt-zinc-cadmium efflux system protein